jgi:hypothetical protein
MTAGGPELTRHTRCRRIRQPQQADSLLRCSPGLPAEPASGLNLLVEKAKATDHGAAPAPWAASACACPNPAGPLEETSMS